MINFDDISLLVQKGKAKDVKELVAQALSEGAASKDILDKGLLAGMSVIGDKFKNNQVFVPEVLVAARAMNAGLEIIKADIADDADSDKGVCIVGTVKGDLHDIGKNIVKIMLEGKGLRVVDLGVNIDPEKFVDAAVENNAKVICCSALLTTTMSVMKEVVAIIEAKGLKGQIKVLVGGAPVTQDFCDKINADGYAPDAASAADLAASLF